MSASIETGEGAGVIRFATHLALEIDRGGADQVAFVVGLLHGSGGRFAHHLDRMPCGVRWIRSRRGRPGG
jgi:hypothetical protein